MDISVFYSWQSDLPNSTNRNFILTALERAAKNIRSDKFVTIEPVVDRDTIGVPGSPNIASTILEKIGLSEIFVCDVSIINPSRSLECRPTPNPNVLIELGYAMSVLGNERIILILNKSYGIPEQLPFDLRMNRVIPYDMPESDVDKATERAKLQKLLEKAIRLIIERSITSLTLVQNASVNLIERLSYYNLKDASDPNFAARLTNGLITLNRNNAPEKGVPAYRSTIFLAIPATEIGEDSESFFKVTREMFDVTRWYNWNSVQKNAPGSRYFSSKVFPINKAVIRTEQNAIIIEDLVQGLPGALFILRINLRGEISLATSYYTTFQPHGEVGVFRLGGIIHFLWSFLCLVKEFQENVNYTNKYHVNVALTNTQEAFLGDFADGWPDILKGNYIRGPEIFDQICHSPNILVSRENTDLSLFEVKVLPDVLRNVAAEIARAFNYPQAYCFEKETNGLPDKLWPYNA